MTTLLLHKNHFLRIAALLGAIALIIGVKSSVSPSAAGSAATRVEVTTLTTSCSGPLTYQFTYNGTNIGQPIPSSTICTSAESVRTDTLSMTQAQLSAIAIGGAYRVVQGGSGYISAARVKVFRLAGTETICILDRSARNCTFPDGNLCASPGSCQQTSNATFGPVIADTDTDGQNNSIDPDLDNDGLLNNTDNCSLVANPTQADTDGNGFGDACDPVDIDGDGIWNTADNCPTTANASQTDTDGNGVGDACQPVVVAVPWLGSELLAHQVYSGGALVLQASAYNPGTGVAIPLTSATWDAGDGSGAVAISATNPLNLERTHTYSGSVGQPFTATISVVDTAGVTYTDTLKVVIAADSRETRVNMAIDKGLWNLHKTMTRNTVEGVAAGFWTGSGYNLAATASSVQAFEINNHREAGNSARDPYVFDVARGLAYITSSANIQKLTTFGLQNGNNPDGNGNGFGLWTNNNDHSTYIGGQVIDAIVASGTPDKVAVTGINPGVKGNTYKTIVQDLLDGYSWGLGDDRGGWHYGMSGTSGGNDTSASHWWAIGVLAANTWDLDAPAWVRNIQLNTGVPLMQDYTVGGPCNHTTNGANGSTLNDGHFGYTDSKNWLWDNGTNTTAAGLVMLNADGVAQTNSRFTCASQFLADRFTTSMGNFYTMYQLTKAMRTAVDGTGSTSSITNLNGTIDWYAGYADYLVTNQTAAGTFSSNGGAIGGSSDLASSWAIIILSPSLFELPPSASCSVSPATIGKNGGTVNFSAAASFHPDPTATITGYTWTFGDATANGSGVTTSHTYAAPASFPTTRNATVLVTDSNGNSATASCPVTIVNNNVPPAATIAGPYTVCKGSELTLVGDATDEDGTINATEWDLNTPVNFATIDATGNTVDATAVFASKAVGTYDIGFRATDNDGAVSSIFSTVRVIAASDPSCNQAPVAVDDSASTLSGTPVTVAILANDTDADNNTLTIGATTPASNGTFVVNGDGTVTYTPNTGFAGTDTFTYTINDGKGGSDTATVTVTVTAKSATASATGGTFTYNANPHTGSCSFVGSDNATLTGTLSYSGGSAPVNVGTSTVTCDFNGTGTNYGSASASASIVINPSPTATTLTTSATPQLAGTPVTFTATVVAVAPGGGTPDGVVTFSEGATVLGTGTLDGSGVATFATTTLSNGPHTITASYNGVPNYLTSNANTVSKLIYGLAAGGGTFVISDTNATMGKAVTFWGAQWQKINIPSGGHSNASFKGFAMTPAVPTVGATFTSAPGNSVPQPSSVPEYIGIIVTSKVTKSGSNISGTIVKLVVVKVDAGYVADPGHAGTGTIVAFVQ